MIGADLLLHGSHRSDEVAGLEQRRVGAAEPNAELGVEQGLNELGLNRGSFFGLLLIDA